MSERQEVESNIDEQQSIIDLSKNDLEKVKNNYAEQINRELSGYKNEKEELNQRIQKYSDSLKRTVLKSPVSGTCKNYFSKFKRCDCCSRGNSCRNSS